MITRIKNPKIEPRKIINKFKINGYELTCENTFAGVLSARKNIYIQRGFFRRKVYTYDVRLVVYYSNLTVKMSVHFEGYRYVCYFKNFDIYSFKKLLIDPIEFFRKNEDSFEEIRLASS